MDLLVRPARPGDGAAISRVFLAATRAGWADFLPADGLRALDSPAERWERELASGQALVAERDGEIVAFAVVRPSRDEDADPDRVGELDTIYVLPSVWGQGAGRSLMTAALDVLRASGFREATLWTAEQNARPRHVYEAAGWRLDGTRRQRTFLGVELIELRYRIGP